MPAAVLIAFLVVERLIELAISRRNLRKAISQGGREYYPETFPTVAALHTLFLLSLILESGRTFIALDVFPIALLLLLIGLQAGRYWCIASLGGRWNARIVVVPGISVSRRGPYRFLRHPNYLIVATEFLLIPLFLHAPLTLLVFVPANLAVLRQRIRLEEKVLGEQTNFQAAFGNLRNPS